MPSGRGYTIVPIILHEAETVQQILRRLYDKGIYVMGSFIRWYRGARPGYGSRSRPPTSGSTWIRL